MTIPPVDGTAFKIAACVGLDVKPAVYPSEEDQVHDDDTPDSFCCLQGCLTGTVVAILFLFVIPSGVILSVYAAKADSESILAVGIVLIITPIITVPVIIAIVRNRKRLRRLRKNKVAHFVDNTLEKY